MAGAKKGEKEARLPRSSCRYALPRPSLVEFFSDPLVHRENSRVSAPVFAASFAAFLRSTIDDRCNSAGNFRNKFNSWGDGARSFISCDKPGCFERKKWRGRSLLLGGDEGIELDGESLEDSIEFGDRRCNEGDEFADRSVRERGMLRLVERRGRK